MSDIISRSALIEALVHCDGLGRKSCEAVIKTINELPTVEAQLVEWIPCSERLPEDFERVLTCDTEGYIRFMDHHHSFEYPFDICPNHPHFFQVIAWMPQPQPYREKVE